MGERIRSQNIDEVAETFILREEAEGSLGQTLIYNFKDDLLEQFQDEPVWRGLPDHLRDSPDCRARALVWLHFQPQTLQSNAARFTQDNLGGLSVVVSIFFYFNYILIFWNYFMAICTDPGRIKKEWVGFGLISFSPRIIF